MTTTIDPAGPVSLTEQLGGDMTRTHVYDFSNHARRTRRRTLSNLEALERMALFLKTGNVRHLPRELRSEAGAIRDLVAQKAAARDPGWPFGAARPYPGHSASFGTLVRALVGDAAADADSGLELEDADGAA